MTIAGSAGGFAPLRQVLADLPADFGAAIAAMLHTSRDSLLAEVLRRRSRLHVCDASRGVLLRSGQVHVAPPGTHLIVNPDARLTVSKAPRVRLFRPSADWLFESAAASFGSRHIAVVLSGMLSDGAEKLRCVKRAGGTVLVQSPEDADHPDMPAAAIATGFVDRVVPGSGLAAAICEVLAARDTRIDAASWESPFDEPAVA